jgi:GNAT superfamily N-acetyltransferase
MTLIRQARPEEIERLTELSVRAKASWGYDEDFMARCRPELTMTAAKLASWTVLVADDDGRLVGMAAFSVDGERAELEEFMVEPDYHGRGVGRALMAEFLRACRARGAKRAGLDADPNAEPIYRSLGFAKIGYTPSRSIPGRLLPRMERMV